MLCAVYFFSSAVGGVFGPYWSLYLKSIGFEVGDISKLWAISLGGSFFAPYLWAWLADCTGRSFVSMRVAAAMSLCLFSGILMTQSFWWLALFLGGFIFSWNGILPQIEANTMNHLEERQGHYGNVRLWSPMGFVVATLIFGALLEDISLSTVPLVVFLLLAIVVLIVFFFSENRIVPSQSNKSKNKLFHVLTQPAVLVFMVVVFLMFISCSPYNVFFSIYLEENGFGLEEISWIWVTGMIAQVLVFFVFHRLMSAFSFKILLVVACALTAIRWLLIGFYVDQVLLLLFAQILQGANIGLFHSVSMHIVHHLFKGEYQYRGHATYISLAGIASITGALASGYLWERFPPSVSFSFATLASVVAGVIAWRYMGEIRS